MLFLVARTHSRTRRSVPPVPDLFSAVQLTMLIVALRGSKHAGSWLGLAIAVAGLVYRSRRVWPPIR
jgi:hypothetical protein